MKYYLLKYSDNWADEMDIDGYVVIDENRKAELEKAIEYLNEHKLGICHCIGSNEEIEYAEVSEDLYSIRELSPDEYKILEKLNILEIGFANSLVECILDRVQDDILYGTEEDEGEDE